MDDSVSEKLAKWLHALYDWLNFRLFSNELPSLRISDSTSDKIKYGMFRGRAFTLPGTDELIDEITIRRNIINDGIAALCLALVRQMIHAWQYHHGRSVPKREGYHNEEYVRKADEIGLEPVFEEAEGGKHNRWKMELEIMKDGKFDRAVSEIPDRLAKSPVNSRVDDGAEVVKSGGKRTKYACPDCGWSCYSKPNQSENKVCPKCAIKYFKSLDGISLLIEMKEGK